MISSRTVPVAASSCAFGAGAVVACSTGSCPECAKESGEKPRVAAIESAARIRVRRNDIGCEFGERFFGRPHDDIVMAPCQRGSGPVFMRCRRTTTLPLAPWQGAFTALREFAVIAGAPDAP